MNRRTALHYAGAALLALTSRTATGATAPRRAAPAQRPTAINVFVKDMHCASCAKRVASRLYAVPGVVRLHVDLKKNLVRVTPQSKSPPSVKSLWEAVEAAQLKPVMIRTATHEFRQKPQK